MVRELATTLGHQDLAHLSSAYSRKETSLSHLVWASTSVSLVLVVLSWSSLAALFRSNLYASFSHVKCISGPAASGSFSTNVHVDIMRAGSNILTITQAREDIEFNRCCRASSVSLNAARFGHLRSPSPRSKSKIASPARRHSNGDVRDLCAMGPTRDDLPARQMSICKHD